MERQMVLYKEGASVTDRAAAACWLCNNAGKDICEVHDCYVAGGKETSSLNQTKQGFRSDLLWWATSLASCSVLSRIDRSHYMSTVTSDPSGSWECGAYTSSGKWFQFECLKVWKEVHRTLKELLPVVVALALWVKKTGVADQCGAIVTMLRWWQ